MVSKEELEKLKEIFFPHLLPKIESLKEGEISLVHYTSAETALKIIREKKVWMRNANFMADYMEIRTGTKKIKDVFDPQTGSKGFWESLDEIKFGLKEKVHEYYNGWVPQIEANSYLFCVSEHSKKEDDIGRLSMWRGYGGSGGVALILNSAPFLAETMVLGAGSYPVIYHDHEKNLRNVIDGVVRNIGFLSKFDEKILISHFLFMLISFTFCLKHKGFEEEREWRVVYLETLAQKMRENSHLKDIPLPIKSELELVKNIPQDIFKIPLQKIEGLKPEETLDLELKNLINRLIIGPCKNPEVLKDIFVRVLRENNVENAEKKVHISHIPLRI